MLNSNFRELKWEIKWTIHNEQTASKAIVRHAVLNSPFIYPCKQILDKFQSQIKQHHT